MSAQAHHGDVRYGKGSEIVQGFLKMALVNAWGSRCYWCRRIGDQTDFEIDHIVPRTRREEGIRVYNLADNFDVDRTYNLAPICAAGPRCNQGKSDALFAGTGAITQALAKAKDRAFGIDERVRRSIQGRGLNKAIGEILVADLTSKTKELIADQGTALVQRIYAADPAAVEDWAVTYAYTPDPDIHIGEAHGCAPDDVWDIPLDFDADARSAKTVLEVVLHLPFDQFLDEALAQLVDEAAVLASEQLSRGDGWGSDVQVAGRLSIVLSGLRVETITEAALGDITFALDAELSGHYFRSGLTYADDEQRETTADVFLDAVFLVEAHLPLDDAQDRLYEAHGIQVDVAHN